MYSKDALKEVVRQKALEFGDFVLASGKKATFYFFEKNMQNLESILGLRSVDSMSHPCGNYNEDTLNILRKMGIKIGFRSSISTAEIKSDLEIPREDHANILKAMSL